MPKPKKNEAKQDYLRRCTAKVITEGKDSKQAYAMCNAFWDTEKKQRSALNLTLAPEFASKKDGDPRREFLITAYTGKKIRAWWNDMVIDISGIKTKEKMPILREHARDRVVGYGDAWKDGNFYISGYFSESTKDAKEVLALADEGFPWQASVSVRAIKVETLKDEKNTALVNGETVKGPMEIWRESKVGEVSFVSLGADDDTAAITMSDDKFDVEEISAEIDPNGLEITQYMEDIIMTLDELKQKHPELLAEIELAAEKKGTDKGVAQERGRVTAILSIDGDPKVARDAIEKGLSEDQSYKLFFEAEKGRKAASLKELEASATESAGAQEPDIKKPVTDKPDAELSRRAVELMEKEKIGIEEAMNRVLADDPALKKAYEATYLTE